MTSNIEYDNKNVNFHIKIIKLISHFYDRF